MLLISDVRLGNTQVDIWIADGRFVRIAPHDQSAATQAEEATERIDGRGLAIFPPFYNGHTHAAMTLLRGYADDQELHDWLHNYIWPAEARLTTQQIYNGSRLAILEMIKSGTVFFADMYWQCGETIRAAEEMGIRAAIGITMMDRLSTNEIETGFAMLRDFRSPSGRISLTVAPHAIYSAGADLLQRSAKEARTLGLKLHIHLSETRKEVEDCIAEQGCSPVAYLERLGVLGPNVIIAHGVHLSDDDVALLALRGVSIVHNPISNLKISSGFFNMPRLLQAGCRVALGTDGAATNNNLDMSEEMKFAALLARGQHSPSVVSAPEILRIATQNGAEAFGLDGGVIAEGKLADALLVSLHDHRMIPCHDLTSNWVYSADRGAIDTVICDGRILMQRGVVAHEAEILSAVMADTPALYPQQ